MCDERNRSIRYNTSSYEGHTFKNKEIKKIINLLTASVPYHVEIGQLIYWFLYDGEHWLLMVYVLVSRNEISTCSSRTDFTIRLHEEINFHLGKAGQF